MTAESTVRSVTTTGVDHVAQAIEMGARPWSKDGVAPRYYLDRWMEIAGYQVSRYGTGNLREVIAPTGDPISNSEGNRLSRGVAVWVDDERGVCAQVTGRLRSTDALTIASQVAQGLVARAQR